MKSHWNEVANATRESAKLRFALADSLAFTDEDKAALRSFLEGVRALELAHTWDVLSEVSL